jgi:hypothetical protein
MNTDENPLEDAAIPFETGAPEVQGKPDAALGDAKIVEHFAGFVFGYAFNYLWVDNH